MSDTYIFAQDLMYGSTKDPWGNIDTTHPRYNLYQQLFKMMVATILPRYKTVVDMGCGVGGVCPMTSAEAEERS